MNSVDEDASLLVTSPNTVDLLFVMSNATRLRMMQLMTEGEITVGDLARKAGISQSATSQHLRRMNDAEILERRRDKQTIFYKLASGPVEQILKFIESDNISRPIC